MADSKLSALTAATTINDADIIYLVQSAVDKKITWATLKALIAAYALADSSVSTAKIADAAVTTVKIEDDAVDKDKINADIVGAGLEQLTDGSIRAEASKYGSELFPCFTRYTAGDIDDELDSSPVAYEYQGLGAIRSCKLYGSDPEKFHKMWLIRRNYDGTGVWAIIVDRLDSGTWTRLFYKQDSGVTENANGVTRWDFTSGNYRFVADVDWSFIPDTAGGGFEALETDDPKFVFTRDCISGAETVDLLEPTDFKSAATARQGYDLYPCFKRVRSGDMDDIETGTTMSCQALAAFKYLRIIGMDYTAGEIKVGFLRRDSSNIWAIILNQYNSGTATWDRVYYGQETGLTEEASGVTRWDNTTSGIRVIADIDWSYVESGYSAFLFGGEQEDPSFIPLPECFIDRAGQEYISSVPSGELRDFQAWRNEFPDVIDKLPLFKAKILDRADDIHILVVGDSLSAQHNKTELSSPENLAPGMTHKTWDYLLWNYLQDNEVICDRYDSTVNSFTETGTFTKDYTFYESPTLPSWTEENQDDGQLTARCATASCSVMFSWALDTYEKLNFVYRKDFRASDDVTISVSTGSGKVEVYDEGTSSWVEANTYNFSQQITEWAQGNYKAQTLKYVRLKMRKASGATGTPNITFTKGTDSDYLMYWGTERWNGSAIFITNVAVGGFRVNQLRDKYLNDVIDRQPDLLVYQVPLTNEYSDYRATTQTILNNVHDFIWGDRSGATTTNCLKNHTTDWADFEVLCLIPHWRYEYVSDNKFIRNYLTDADESAFIVWQRVKKLFLDHNDVPFIDIGQQMKAEAFARGWTLAESYTGTDNDSLDSFTRDTVHQNDLGGTMWAKCIAPVLDVRNL